MQFITPFNYYEQTSDEVLYEFNDEPSLTVPDQSLTIEQILIKFAHGESLNLGSSYYYETDDANASFSDLDASRSEGFDLADASMLQASLERNKQRAREEEEERQRQAKQGAKSEKGTPAESELQPEG